ncbi:1474_t:CDS:2 [Paraglomus occultum]|uniref:1474_t:CDS:1 n=1 Tax=Paraglomus occultum TaxID=144539 RepID=A0A9N9GND7_9GLOM|nr:1474_t:CDS:2 [Paraglomus occultum]
MAQNVVWIRLEDKTRAKKFPIVDGNTNHDLDDLAAELCKKGRLQTLKIDPDDLEFFGDYDKIVVNAKLVNAPTQITLVHNTGAWKNLLIKTNERYPTTQDEVIYFVDQATKKKVIDDDFTFFDVVKKTKLNSEDEIVLDLAVKIEGKKAYGDWTAKEVLHDLLKDRYKKLGDLSGLDIALTELTLVAIEENELGIQVSQAEEDQPTSSASGNKRAHSDDEEKGFVALLQEIADVFQNNVNKNEATSRNFINPFLIKGIKKVQSEYPEMFLSVEEEFNGTRGYGKLDYAVWYLSYAILVTEAKMNAIEAGIIQNLAQLYTASENLKRKRESPILSMIYGIVTTGTAWIFIRWKDASGSADVKYSKTFNCSFHGKMEEEKTILDIIVRILRSQAKELKENMEAEIGNRGKRVRVDSDTKFAEEKDDDAEKEGNNISK